MIVTCVHVSVKKEFIQNFIDATIINHSYSIQEPGNLRFDVLQSSEDPSKFMLYEAYESVEASAEHKKTSHYLTWKQTVADWMATPREGVPYVVIQPKDASHW